MGYRISELADRTGFSTSTLRYYEAIGLMPAPERTSTGYRVYDDDAVDRLAFIRRGKSIGLSLEQINELVELWDNGSCAPVQERLRAVIEMKLTEARQQDRQLQRFAAQLEQLSTSLAGAEPADRCGPGCGCDAHLSAATEPMACTLSASEAVDRSTAWAEVLAQVIGREPIDDGVCLRLPSDVLVVARVAELAVREADCCAFFSFVVSVDRKGAWLTVTAPPDGGALLDALFGVGAG